jgi:predicted DNA binding CopG/RHH family protein
MNSRKNYSDEPMGEVRIVPDFLPSPSELAFREETVKVTIALSKASIDFFKQEATRHQVSYQKMIRRLLDEYAHHHAA